MLVDVGAVEDFEDGVPRVLTLNGRQVGVVTWHGEVYAVRNICPHQLGPVCTGHTMPLILSENGVARVDEDTLVLVCPWHSWEFEARTGKSLWTDRFRLKTYPAKVEAGRVLVEGGKPEAVGREAGETPAVAQA
jgi:nitrite reductase/ring-hydroxylating ferredoxin subunit